MPRIFNWTKLDRKVYQYEPNPDIELRLLNETETRMLKLGWHQWVLAIFRDDEFEQVVVYGLDGYNEARREATQWMRAHPYMELVA